MKAHLHRYFFAILSLAVTSSAFAEKPKVTEVKQFSGIYPSSCSLQIPFNGCVVLDAPLPPGDGEFWLSLDHLIKDDDFMNIEVLVNSKATILGARAKFKGGLEEWRGARGYASRKRVLYVFCLDGDGPPLSEKIPLAYDGSDFGEMVYTFDEGGHVSWRCSADCMKSDEAAYVEFMENHKRNCEECKNIHTAASVILSIKNTDDPSKSDGVPNKTHESPQ